MSVIPTLPIVNVQVGTQYGSKTIQLPAASTVNETFFLVRDVLGNCSLDPTGAIFISTTGGDTIDGLSSITLRTPYQAVKFLRNAPSGWSIQQNYKGGTPLFNFLNFSPEAGIYANTLFVSSGFEYVENALQVSLSNGTYYTSNLYPTKSFQTSFTFTMDEGGSNGFCFVIQSNALSPGSNYPKGAPVYLTYGYDGWAGNYQGSGAASLANSLAVRFVGAGANSFTDVNNNVLVSSFFSTSGNAIITGEGNTRLLAVGEDYGLGTYRTKLVLDPYSTPWFSQTIPNMAKASGATYVGGYVSSYVIVGQGTSPDFSILLTSSLTQPVWSSTIFTGFSVAGNGIATGLNDGLSVQNNMVFVGEGTTKQGKPNTIMYSTDSGNSIYNVSQANGAFDTAGNGVIKYTPSPTAQYWVATGADSMGSTIKYTSASNGIFQWSNTTGDLPSIGYGVGLGTLGKRFYVLGADNDPLKTIVYNTSNNPADDSFHSISTGGFDIAGRALAYGGSPGTYVAVGQHTSTLGTIQYSTDGSNFSAANNGFQVAGYSVVFVMTFLGGMFYAAGDDTGGTSNIKYSTDGINWNDIAAPDYPGIPYNLFYGGGSLLYAAGNGPSSIYSYDTTGPFGFQPVAANGFTTSAFGVAVANLGALFAVGPSAPINTTIQKYNSMSNIFVPAPGLGVTSVNVNSVANSVLTDGTNILVAACDDTNSNGRIKISYDGSTWYNSSQNNFTSAKAVTSLYQSTFFAVGTANIGLDTIEYSENNGVTWASGTSLLGFSGGGYGIYYASSIDVMVAVGEDAIAPGTIKYAVGPNYTIWNNALSGGFSVRGTSVTYDPIKDLWIATGQDSNSAKNIQISSDGAQNWIPVSQGGYDYRGNGLVYSELDTTVYSVGVNSTITVSPIEYLSVENGLGVDFLGAGYVSTQATIGGIIPNIDPTRPTNVNIQGAGGILSYSVYDSATNVTFTSNTSSYINSFGVQSIGAFSSLIADRAFYGFTGTTNGGNNARILNWSLAANPYP